MSHEYYATRLWWSGSKGIAKLHGRVMWLEAVPVIPGVPGLVGVDYTPEVGVARVITTFSGWRDMTREEVGHVDRFLRHLHGDNFMNGDTL